MSLETKREIGDAIINSETTNSDTVEYEMSFLVHGGEEPKFNTETVEYDRREPRTYTEEVTIPSPIQDPEDAESKTVEGENYDPSPEEVIEWQSEYLNADEVGSDDSDIPAPGEMQSGSLMADRQLRGACRRTMTSSYMGSRAYPLLESHDGAGATR